MSPHLPLAGRFEDAFRQTRSDEHHESHFDGVLAINSMQVWPNAIDGLRDIRRVMKPGAKIVLGFTRYSGQPKGGLTETLVAAGFVQPQVVEIGGGFCALASKP
jgi:SAM-dependent methyltransferase